MTFYDAKLNKFGNFYGGKEYKGSTPGTFSEASRGVIYFGHAFSQRVVAFHGFVDGFILDTDYGVSIYKTARADTGRIDQKVSTFSYKFTLNVPAESVIESKANLAKFQELSRYINNPKGRIANPHNRQSYIYVLFGNLIQNGLYTKGFERVESWAVVRKYGAKCYMASIDFKPDMDLGFFEHGGYLTPKSYSLSITLNLQPEFINGDVVENEFVEGNIKTSTKVCINSFTKQGDYRTKKDGPLVDTKFWPFGVTLGLTKANGYHGGYDGSTPYAISKGAQIGIKHPPPSSKKFVTFKAFLNDFSFKKEIETKPVNNEDSGTQKIVLGGGIKQRTYNFSIDVPAHSVNEARANLAKFQALIRMSIKSFKPGTILEDGGGEVRVYFQNLISMPHSPSFGNTLSAKYIEKNGVLVAFKKVTLTVDMDLGFYDLDNFLYPKSYKLSFDFEILDSNLPGRQVPYNRDDLGLGDNSQWPFGIKYSNSSEIKRSYNTPHTAIGSVTSKSSGAATGGVGMGHDPTGGASNAVWDGMFTEGAPLPPPSSPAPNQGENQNAPSGPSEEGTQPTGRDPNDTKGEQPTGRDPNDTKGNS